MSGWERTGGSRPCLCQNGSPHGGRSSAWLERQVVALKAGGSSPLAHPNAVGWVRRSVRRTLRPRIAPLAQRQSNGLLIRRFWVRNPGGAPQKSWSAIISAVTRHGPDDAKPINDPQFDFSSGLTVPSDLGAETRSLAGHPASSSPGVAQFSSAYAQTCPPIDRVSHVQARIRSDHARGASR